MYDNALKIKDGVIYFNNKEISPGEVRTLYKFHPEKFSPESLVSLFYFSHTGKAEDPKEIITSIERQMSGLAHELDVDIEKNLLDWDEMKYWDEMNKDQQLGSLSSCIEQVWESTPSEGDIIKAIISLANKGHRLSFEEDWGENSLTFYFDGRHTHLGRPKFPMEFLMRDLHYLLKEIQETNF